MYFGVPQSRQRLIFVGVRDDLDGGPTVPAPTTRPHTLRYALTPPPDAKHDGDNVSPLRAHRWLDTPRGGAHKERFSLKRLSWSRPSNALIKVSGSGGLMHPDEPRLLNTGECQRVGSFPDAFEFVGSWSDSVARIGNSVPPLFMRAIAQHVRETILTPELSLAP
jgi:DNA (cytosine-5)-methyltransferase 1